MDHPQSEQKHSPRSVPAVSAILPDGSIVEMVHEDRPPRTSFVVWKDGAWRREPSVPVGESERLVPYSAGNNLIVNKVVLFASEPEEYGSQAELVAEVGAFIRRYVDVTPLFEKVATHYVLLSWIYEGFSELPYLRLRGEPGCGKTRFLLTVGALCYKPIFASGASTVSPLFRILDAFRGTLIVDEGDFRLSDERAEIVKILNNGNAKGFPVLRTEVSGRKEFNPTAYHVFGPKLVATRRPFEDRALESRCLTEAMGQYGLRADVPISLPPAYEDEARRLRNKLLLFRFRNLRRVRTDERLIDPSIEPRLNQVFVPLLSIVDDDDARAGIRELARSYNREMIGERAAGAEAQVLGVIREILASGGKASVNAIAERFMERHGGEYERAVTPRWIGGIVRTRLGLRTQKSNGVFVLPPSEEPKLQRLYERYGIATGVAAAEEAGAEGGGDGADADLQDRASAL
ncbi:MAG TPA: hypothetical protein VI306_09890 [Pyrinomonadaceae bacterium]